MSCQPGPPIELMRAAIEKCREGLQRGQSPFGCAIAIGDDVLAVTHNEVVAKRDITAHAEITALRKACRRQRHHFLDGATVATTCEPCPMCAAALHWARVETVYFGATIDDARRAGFNELTVPAEHLLRRGQSAVKLVPGLLADECRDLFSQWLRNPSRVSY